MKQRQQRFYKTERAAIGAAKRRATWEKKKAILDRMANLPSKTVGADYVPDVPGDPF